MAVARVAAVLEAVGLELVQTVAAELEAEAKGMEVEALRFVS